MKSFWLLCQRTRISDELGQEIIGKSVINFVQVSTHVPGMDPFSFPWDASAYSTSTAPTSSSPSGTALGPKTTVFNLVSREDLPLTFDCAGDMLDLVFVIGHKGQDPLVVYCAGLGSLQMDRFCSPKQCLSQTTLLREEILHCTRRYTLNVLERAVYSFQRLPKGGKMFVRVMDYLHLLNFGWRTTSSSSSYPKTNCIRAEFCVGPFVN